MDSILMALESIRDKKIRSFLTMLGIIIGVGAVLILVSVVQGYNADLTAYYEKQGVNKVNVTMTNYDRTNSTDQSGEFMDWVDTALADYITGVSPSYSTTGTLKYYGSSNTTAKIYFGNEQWSACNNFTLNEGRDLTKLDVEGKNLTCVIGSNVADSLSGIGGVIGILLGYAGSLLAGKLIYDLILFPEPWMTLAAFLFSLLIGVGFGMYPAVKASGLQPVDALRAD